MPDRSMHYVGSQETTNYFIDDSALNVRGALEFGWDKTLLFLEGDREYALRPSLNQSFCSS